MLSLRRNLLLLYLAVSSCRGAVDLAVYVARMKSYKLRHEVLKLEDGMSALDLKYRCIPIGVGTTEDRK